MATPQETKKDVMSKVNGVMAAINLYPKLNPTNTQLSFSPSPNPIDLLVDFFKTTKGYDWLIETISKFISHELPALELAVKGVLLSNIRIMLSCSVSPLITENMINNGIVVDLNKIDLLNIFNYSPLNKKIDNPGKYYYFGCDPEDGINTIDDLKQTRDFNALLWYAKNTPGERIVWKRESDVGKPPIVSNIGGNWKKQVKSNGIATIEFNGRSSGLKKADGSQCLTQEPIDNCLHLFIGYCAPVTNNYKKQIEKCTKYLAALESIYQQAEDYRHEIEQIWFTDYYSALNRGATPIEVNKIDRDTNTDLHTLDRLQHAINGVDIDNPESGNTTIGGIMGGTSFELNTIHKIITVPSELSDKNVNIIKSEKISYIEQDIGTENSYPSPKSNYYYLHPLFEWNTDFIMSIKLFDEKVITAQLIEALTKCLSINTSFTITPQMKFMQEQINDLVRKIIETDDGVVSDCFFSFSNDRYNQMLNEVQLNRLRLHSVDQQTTNVVPSIESVMKSLNTLSHDATKEEIQSVVSGTLFSATSSTKPEVVGDELKLNTEFSANFTIIDDLLTQLTYVIVSTILQPKVYTLLMANLTVVGSEPNFDLSKFIQQFSDLIIELIKSIRDQILQYFTNELLKILNELVKNLAVKLTLEQYQYYITLITHCIECLRLHRNEYDWIQDDVDYADIIELNQTEKQEC